MNRASNLCCALLAAGILLALVGGGCTSDDPNEVGLDLVTISLDTVLAPLGLRNINQFSALAIEDSRVDFDNQQVVYLGTQEGDSSSFLANFDFGDPSLFEGFDDSLFTLDKIQTVNFSLQKVAIYGKARSQTIGDEIVNIPAPDIHYRISRLDAPIDSSWTPPIPVPDHGLPFIDDIEGGGGDQPLLPMSKVLFLDWYNAKEVIGVLIEAGPGSDPGLVGYASRDLTAYIELDNVAVGTVVAVNFVVNFADEEVNFLLPPFADLSTFHKLTEPPADVADGMLLRSSLRSYPALLFDFAGLPPNAYINRATLRVTADTSRSFGTLATLAASELDSIYFTSSPGAMTVDDLGSRIFQITGVTNADPYQVITYEFNVTEYVQRRVNEVYEGTRGIVVGVGEWFNTGYQQTPTAEFYFNEIRFMGTSAPDSLQMPHLRITYTRIGDIRIGGEGSP